MHCNVRYHHLLLQVMDGNTSSPSRLQPFAPRYKVLTALCPRSISTVKTGWSLNEPQSLLLSTVQCTAHHTTNTKPSPASSPTHSQGPIPNPFPLSLSNLSATANREPPNTENTTQGPQTPNAKTSTGPKAQKLNRAAKRPNPNQNPSRCETHPFHLSPLSSPLLSSVNTLKGKGKGKG